MKNIAIYHIRDDSIFLWFCQIAIKSDILKIGRSVIKKLMSLRLRSLAKWNQNDSSVNRYVDFARPSVYASFMKTFKQVYISILQDLRCMHPLRRHCSEMNGAFLELMIQQMVSTILLPFSPLTSVPLRQSRQAPETKLHPFGRHSGNTFSTAVLPGANFLMGN